MKVFPIIKEKTFPVLLFSPGTGCSAELYENFITELVSQGYIVVGINTPFLNLVALPNGHVVIPTINETTDFQFTALQKEDLAYVYDQIHRMHNENPLFLAMDLRWIGAFGHSRGAGVVANTAHEHEKWFQAAAALDVGWTGEPKKIDKFAIPFMHEIAAYRVSMMQPSVFELGDKNYLVRFAPNEQDHDYTAHMNFSDDSTLQYTPAFQKYLEYLKGKHVPDPIEDLGKGNGWEVTDSVRIYLVKFFDTFLKGSVDPAFKRCSALAKNTYMKCGPDVFPIQ